jgi:uncharacterized protein (DUF305 family)
VKTLRARSTTILLLSTLAAGCASRAHPPATPAPTSATSADEHHHTDSTTSAPAAHGMHGMHDMHAMHGMSAPIVIPKGVLYTEADVRFMQGMIAHHAQAIHMSRLATSRGADPRLLRFALKIDQSQWAEIRLMQDWLHAHGQVAPDTSSWRTMSMPGMLTADEIAQLDAARGPEFDRLFLTLMIRHHEGALMMVAELLATPRAAQDVDVNVFANDVEAVQTAEIAVMRQMLTDR